MFKETRGRHVSRRSVARTVFFEGNKRERETVDAQLRDSSASEKLEGLEVADFRGCRGRGRDVVLARHFGEVVLMVLLTPVEFGREFDGGVFHVALAVSKELVAQALGRGELLGVVREDRGAVLPRRDPRRVVRPARASSSSSALSFSLSCRLCRAKKEKLATAQSWTRSA